MSDFGPSKSEASLHFMNRSWNPNKIPLVTDTITKHSMSSKRKNLRSQMKLNLKTRTIKMDYSNYFMASDEYITLYARWIISDYFYKNSFDHLITNFCSENCYNLLDFYTKINVISKHQSVLSFKQFFGSSFITRRYWTIFISILIFCSLNSIFLLFKLLVPCSIFILKL